MSTYTVKSGDTLQSIAMDLFSDESMASYLASINNIKAVVMYCIAAPCPALYPLKVGQVLNTGVAEVSAKKMKPLIIALELAFVAGIGYVVYKAGKKILVK